jgi:hypothetical protein
VLKTHVVEVKTAKTGSPDKSINKCKLEIQIRWQIHICNPNSNSCKEKSEIGGKPLLS